LTATSRSSTAIGRIGDESVERGIPRGDELERAGDGAGSTSACDVARVVGKEIEVLAGPLRVAQQGGEAQSGRQIRAPSAGLVLGRPRPMPATRAEWRFLSARKDTPWRAAPAVAASPFTRRQLLLVRHPGIVSEHAPVSGVNLALESAASAAASVAFTGRGVVHPHGENTHVLLGVDLSGAGA
jgi:hypothetical protein